MAHGLELLGGTEKRVRIHDSSINFKLPAAVKVLVNEYAEIQKVSEATVVRWALADFFERKGYDS